MIKSNKNKGQNWPNFPKAMFPYRNNLMIWQANSLEESKSNKIEIIFHEELSQTKYFINITIKTILMWTKVSIDELPRSMQTNFPKVELLALPS